MVQQLRLHASNARNAVSIPGRVTKIPHAAQCGQKSKKREGKKPNHYLTPKPELYKEISQGEKCNVSPNEILIGHTGKRHCVSGMIPMSTSSSTPLSSL